MIMILILFVFVCEENSSSIYTSEFVGVLCELENDGTINNSAHVTCQNKSCKVLLHFIMLNQRVVTHSILFSIQR